MYMPALVAGHIKICEANDYDYRNIKRKETMNIINSEDCFSKKEG
ncbi:MAG: hypothetical protein EZS28_040392, partial [Streblomastix strix]